MAILMNCLCQKGLKISEKRSRRGYEREKPGNMILLVFAMENQCFLKFRRPSFDEKSIKRSKKIGDGTRHPTFYVFGRIFVEFGRHLGVILGARGHHKSMKIQAWVLKGL